MGRDNEQAAQDDARGGVGGDIDRGGSDSLPAPSESFEDDLESLAWIVYRYRRRGTPLIDIPDRMVEDHDVHVSLAEVQALYRSAINTLPTTLTPDERREVRKLEMDRLDALQEAAWMQAVRGDLKAIDTALKVITTRAKLFELDALDGTDSNSQVNVLIVGEDKQAFIDALRAGREAKQIMAGPDEDDEDDEEEEAP